MDLGRRHDRASGLAIAGLLVFVGGLAALAVLVPVGHGFAPKGGGWFIPAVVGGVFTLHPLLIAVPWAACFVLGLVDLHNPWRVEHLDLLALAGFFPVAMLLSDDAAQAGLWLAAACLCWLLLRMLGVALGIRRMPELRPSVSSRRLLQAILLLLLVRLASLAGGNILDVGQASSLGAWRLLHGLHLYGAVSWPGPGGLQVYRPDTYSPFAYYAYLPFVAIFPPAPALAATLLPALCFDALTLAGLYKIGLRLGGRPLGQAFVFAYLLFPFPDLSLTSQTNDGLIAALCVWTIAAGAERPAARGLLMAAAALTKFLPGLLALQFLGIRKGRRRYALTLFISLAAMLAWPVITSGPAQFLDSTVGYQLIQRGGGAQFSIWTYLPHAALVARPVLAAALLLLALSPLLRPPVRDVREHAALAAALLIGAQLLLGYWFYSYLTWCYPLLIIAIIRAGPDHGPGRATGSSLWSWRTGQAWGDSPPAGGAEDLRRGGERHRCVRAGQLVDLVDGEPGPLDGQSGVPAAVAAADQPWPDGGVQGPLDATSPGGAGLDVFEEPQFAAGLEDTADLGQRLVLVGDAAQDEGGDRDVEEGVVGGQVAGGTVDDLDRDGGLRGVGLGDGPQVGFRLDRDHLGDRGRVVGEVEAVAGSDFDHPSGRAADERLAVSSDTLFHEEARAGVPAGEEGVAVTHGVLP